MKLLLSILLLCSLSHTLQAQDLIILKSGDEIENIKILDTLDNIIYRKDASAQTIAKADVFMIKYANGTKVKVSSSSNSKGQVTAPKIEQPKKVDPPSNPLVQPVTPSSKKEEEPKDDKVISGVITELDKKMKSKGEDIYKPRGFGFGANFSPSGGGILMPISFSRHFRMELEIGRYGLSSQVILNSDLGDGVGGFDLGLALYGMTQRGRVNFYFGPAFGATIIRDYSTFGYFAPVVGSEYALSDHFTLGADVGLPIYFGQDLDKAVVATRARAMIRFYF